MLIKSILIKLSFLPELRMRNHCVMPKLPRGLAVKAVLYVA